MALQKITAGISGAQAADIIFNNDKENEFNIRQNAAYRSYYGWHLNGTNAYLSKTGVPFLNNTPCEYEITLKMPADPTPNQMIFNLGEFYLNVNGGALVVYHKTAGGASGNVAGFATTYAGKKIVLGLKIDSPTTLMRVLVNGVIVENISGIEPLNATPNPTTIFIGSYTGTGLFSAIEVFNFIVRDAAGAEISRLDYDHPPTTNYLGVPYVYGVPLDVTDDREAEAVFNGTTSFIGIEAPQLVIAGDVNETYLFDMELPAGPFAVGAILTTATGGLQVYLNGVNIAVVKQGVAVMYNFNASVYYAKRVMLAVVRTPTEYVVYANGAALPRAVAGGYASMTAQTAGLIGATAVGVQHIVAKFYNIVKYNRALSAAEVRNLEVDFVGGTNDAYLFLKNDKLAADDWRDLKSQAAISMQNVAVNYPAFIYNDTDAAASLLLAGLPAEIVVVANKEANIYWANVVPNYAKQYFIEFKITGSSVRNMNNGLRILYAATGTYAGTVALYDLDGNVLETKALSILVVAANAGTGTKQFLFTGDSTIDDATMINPTTPYYDHVGPQIVHEFYDFCNANKGFTPLMIGHKRDYPPYLHAGMSGWSSAGFLDSTSPFWVGGAINFASYVSTQIATIAGAANRIDGFYYQIGINDLKNDSTPPETVVANVKTLLGFFLTAYPAAKVLIGMPASGCDPTGWSLHFYGGSSYNIFTAKMRKLQKLYIEAFANGAYAANVHLVNTGHWIDRFYGFPNKLVNTSARSTQQELEHWDSVHPNEGGYNQMADAVVAAFKKII